MSGKVYGGDVPDNQKRATQVSVISSLKSQVSNLENQLNSQRQLLQILNEAFAEGWFTHESGRIQDANNAFCQLTGYELAELKTKHISEVFTPEAETIFQDSSQLDFKPVEIKAKRTGGGLINVRITGKQILHDNRPMGFVIVENISDFVETQSSLKESEERHRLISKMLSDYVYSCKISKDHPPVIEWISGAIEKISGYTIKEIEALEYGWFSVVHPDDIERISSGVGVNFQHNEYNNNQYRIIRKDGEVRWVHDRSTCIHFNEGKGEYRLLGATKDITERKRIEEDLVESNLAFESLNKNLNDINLELSEVNQRLKESERKYKDLIENSAIGVGISKGEKILYANESLLKIYGIDTFEEFASKKLTAYLTPDSKKLVKERLRKYEANLPLDNTYRYQIIRSDGAIRTVQITTNNINFEGQLCRQALITDITKNLETENALQRAASIFTNIQIGILIYRLDDMKDDRSLRLIHANPASAELIGIKEEELIGKRIDEIFPNLRAKKIPQQYAEVVRTQIPNDFDEMVYEDDRISQSVFSVKVFPLPNQSVGISFENVSARRKAEQDLRTRNAELNNFVYKVSHDLRAPLSSIKGLIHLSKLEKNQTDHLPRIEERINRLDEYISDILSHSRNLNTAVIIEEINIQHVIEDCFKELEYLPNASKLDKSVSIKGGAIYSDRIRLSEICRNMISNAIKYQDGEKEEHKLKVKVSISRKDAQFTFEDNGIGIEEEFLQDIFKMFYRATEESEGSGIGLYIVQQALEKINGQIAVKSTLGKGTTFNITIPNLIGEKVATSI